MNPRRVQRQSPLTFGYRTIDKEGKEMCAINVVNRLPQNQDEKDKEAAHNAILMLVARSMPAGIDIEELVDQLVRTLPGNQRGHATQGNIRILCGKQGALTLTVGRIVRLRSIKTGATLG